MREVAFLLYMWTQVTIIIYSNKANALFLGLHTIATELLDLFVVFLLTIMVTTYCTSVRSVSRKMDILTWKVFLCVGGRFNQENTIVAAFPWSGKLSNPCISARWSKSFNIHHILRTGTWLIEHSGRCCSLFWQFYRDLGHKLSKKTSWIGKKLTQWQQFTYLRVTGDMPTKLRMENCLQQTRLQYATTEICLILYKNAYTSQPGGQWAWMLTIFCT